MDGRARCAIASSALALAIASAWGLAGCGSGGSSAAPSTGSSIAGVRFSQCIRAHGVSAFPDPGGAFPAGIKRSPAFRSAMQTCLRLEPPATSTGKQFTGSQRIAALAQVRCIRDHGLANFPDPTFPRTGGELLPAIPGFNPASPAFRHAATACGLKGSVGQPRGG